MNDERREEIYTVMNLIRVILYSSNLTLKVDNVEDKYVLTIVDNLDDKRYVMTRGEE